MLDRTCEVEECERAPRSAGSVLCSMHYHRWYRHGSVHKVAATSGISASHGRRYQSRYLPTHPLASKHGKVYIHRAVLYDKIGPGSASCHWCGRTVRWESTRGDEDCLNADHLNGFGDDNRAANLVPSCPGCNTMRGSQARGRALRDAGWWSSHDTIDRLRRGGRKPELEPERR